MFAESSRIIATLQGIYNTVDADNSGVHIYIYENENVCMCVTFSESLEPLPFILSTLCLVTNVGGLPWAAFSGSWLVRQS